MAYLPNAPPALIKLYEKRSQVTGQFVPLLGKLLCERRMARSWSTIRKYIRNDMDFERLWKNIIFALAGASKGSVRPGDERKLGDIAKTAQELLAMIAEPQILPADGTTPLYRGDLDLFVYEFFPEDVASNLGPPSWATIKSDERSNWAQSLPLKWPTMVEVLDQLARGAKQLRNNKESVVHRDRGRAYWVIVIRKLYEFFIGVNRRFKSIGFAPIKDIANVVMIARWERQVRDAIRDGKEPPPKPTPLTSKQVRTIICGASGRNLPIKSSRNIPAN